ncbi:hypothetical protein [Geomesophilobacter sediminis]|uniref:Uncharacterized protein n=1 Tax=Geomesophilobacter sediminis TaxID=2798584 RepID=A0A8J7M2H0_9BACT|nr:hypothetical protein [Geomesophilobacter sediminis]MBJ6727515.1 hypothetical protein [Geomesophilobacter sediminis]
MKQLNKSLAIVCSIVFLAFLYWLTSPPPLLYLAFLVAGTGVWALLAWLGTTVRKPLGSYPAIGTKNVVTQGIYRLCVTAGGKSVQVDSDRANVSMFGITEIRQDLNIYGDVIEFLVEEEDAGKCRVQIYGRRRMSSRMFFSQDEMKAYRYDAFKIRMLLQEIINI